MKTMKELMDEVKVESYKDCVWYLEEIDRCKMCDVRGINFDCNCKEEMANFCIWLTKFFKSSTGEEIEIKEEDEKIAEAYLSLDKKDDEEHNSLFKIIMDALK